MSPTAVKTTLAILLISIVSGAVYLEIRSNAEKDTLKQEAKRQEGLALAYKAQYDGLVPQIKAIADANDRLEATISDLKKKVSAIPIPPPPGPAPDDPSVKSDLESAGLKFDWSTSSNALTHDSAKIIWTWHVEALNAPRLRLALSDYQSLVKEQDKLLEGKNAQIGLLNDGVKNLGAAYDAQAKRAEALDGAVKACESARRASTVKWYFKVGAGVVAGYLAGRAMK